MLMTQRQMLNAQNLRFPNPERIPKVSPLFALVLLTHVLLLLNEITWINDIEQSQWSLNSELQMLTVYAEPKKHVLIYLVYEIR